MADWDIRLDRLRVWDAQEESWISDGDEPYFVMIGFRSRFFTPNSTSAFYHLQEDDEWAEGSSSPASARLAASRSGDIPELEQSAVVSAARLPQTMPCPRASRSRSFVSLYASSIASQVRSRSMST